MLILPEKEALREVREARDGITNHFNAEMEKILNANKALDKYWILGKAKVHKAGEKRVVKPFLQACTEKPGLIKESFVYEVDNRRGVKTLLWVMHANETLSFPTLGKAIRTSGGKTEKTIVL